MKIVTTILLLSFFSLVGGFIYGLIAGRVSKGREPWFTLCMLCGLGVSVCAVAWLTGASWTVAVGVFVGASLLFAILRKLFGRGSDLEMFILTHVFAIMLLLLFPAIKKARRLHEMRSNQSITAIVAPLIEAPTRIANR